MLLYTLTCNASLSRVASHWRVLPVWYNSLIIHYATQMSVKWCTLSSKQTLSYKEKSKDCLVHLQCIVNNIGAKRHKKAKSCSSASAARQLTDQHQHRHLSSPSQLATLSLSSSVHPLFFMDITLLHYNCMRTHCRKPLHFAGVQSPRRVCLIAASVAVYTLADTTVTRAAQHPLSPLSMLLTTFLHFHAC